MKQITLVVNDPDGIHARPAGILVKRMQDFPCIITVRKDDREADGKKLFAIMKMAVKKGDSVLFTAEGEQEEEAIEAIAQIFEEANL